MKVLVTGAQGQVGSELIKQGQGLGHQMIAAGRAELDITQKDVVNEFINGSAPDIVINAAAYTAVDKAEEQHDLAYTINRDGPTNLAQVCAQHGIPLLHISTDYLFDGSKDAPWSEDDRPNPQGVYGRSKLEGDRAVENILEQQITLRVAWVFGASGNNFVRTMLRLARERDELSIVADQHGGPTWAGDIATVLLNIVERYQRGETIPWGTYHYSGAPATTWHGFALAIFEAAVAEGLIDKAPWLNAITTAEYPTPAKRPKNSVLNGTKIDRELGIKQPDWKIGLGKVLRTWKANLLLSTSDL